MGKMGGRNDQISKYDLLIRVEIENRLKRLNDIEVRQRNAH
jgi:hypothetical protein